MKTIENTTLELVNAGIGLAKTAEEQLELAFTSAGQAFSDLRRDAQGAFEGARRNVERTFEDLKIKGALYDSDRAHKVREVAVNTARRIA